MPNIVRITDPESGAEAHVAPELGFNCFRFAVQYEGKPLEILWSAPNFAAGTERPSSSGIPLLFPFPGRIRGTTFEWNGKQYELEEGDGCGNAIHGFVHKRAWRVIRQTESSVTGEFQASVDDPSILKRWPGDFHIQAQYTVSRDALKATYEVFNPAVPELPFGFGTHAYFRTPLGGPSAADCQIMTDVREEWELANMLPTGVTRPSPHMAELSSGLRLGEIKFDSVFSSGERSKANMGQLNCEIIDPNSGIRVLQRCPRDFPYCVIYTPPHREAVCLEPYTCVPDCFRLDQEGILAGQRTLATGATWTARIYIRVISDHGPLRHERPANTPRQPRLQ